MKIINKKINIIPGIPGIPGMLLLAAVMFLVGCSSIGHVRKKGMELTRKGNHYETIKHYQEAILKHPSKSELRTLLFKAKLSCYYTHLALARKYKKMAKEEQSVKEYKAALKLFPDNKKVANELDSLVNKDKKKKKPFVSSIVPPISLKADTSEKITLNLKSTPITKIFKMVGKSYNLNFVFDKDFRDFVYTIEIEDIGFFDVLNQLCMVGNAKYRIVDPSSILIYPNTTFKDRTFGLQGVKIFYLSNTKAEDTKKLVLTVFRDQKIQIQEDKGLNCLITKGSINTLREIEKFLYSVDKIKSEVELDVEILELNRNLVNSLGLDYGDAESAVSTISFGQLEHSTTTDADTGDSITTTTVNGGPFTIPSLAKLSFFVTVPSVALSFLKADTNTKILSKPNLRSLDGEEVKFMVGDEVPILQTQFQSSGAGGYGNIPVASYNYKSVGVDIKLTPTIHKNNDVSIKIKLKMDFITGYVGAMPQLGKRELECIIRLKEGETSIIGGFIKDEDRDIMKGIPFLSKIPVLGKLFGSTTKGSVQTDLVFSITPRIIRKIDITEQDKGAIWLNTNQSVGATNASKPGNTPKGPGGPDERKPDARKRAGKNSVIIAPRKRKIPVNSVSYFTIRLNAGQDISSLAVGGSISGAKAEIQQLKVDYFGGKDDVKTMKNSSGDSFDLGYSFTGKPIKNSILAQLKIKFLEKGQYTISISNASGMSKDGKSVDLTTNSAEVEVY